MRMSAVEIGEQPIAIDALKDGRFSRRQHPVILVTQIAGSGPGMNQMAAPVVIC